MYTLIVINCFKTVLTIREKFVDLAVNEETLIKESRTTTTKVMLLTIPFSLLNRLLQIVFFSFFRPLLLKLRYFTTIVIFTCNTLPLWNTVRFGHLKFWISFFFRVWNNPLKKKNHLKEIWNEYEASFLSMYFVFYITIAELLKYTTYQPFHFITLLFREVRPVVAINLLPVIVWKP